MPNRLREAAIHLKQARLSLVAWVNEAGTAGRVADKADDLEDILVWARKLEEMRIKLELRASVEGG
jgi:hypothetical protein